MTFPHHRLKVGLRFQQDEQPLPVGTLALARQGRAYQIYFQYEPAFLGAGLALSPLHLPLEAKVFQFTLPAFENLPGVFNDSLPDGWGRLLFDRFIRRHSLDLSSVSPLDRLAHAGGSALGALVYQPAIDDDEQTSALLDLNQIARETKAVLTGASDSVLKELLALNGSSAGARPKALIGVDAAHNNIMHNAPLLPDGFTPWIVKFPNGQDGADAGAIEYVYALMAKEAGLLMPETHLFPAQSGAGFFAVRRFDRDGRQHFHMHTASGLLHADFRTPSLDYRDIMALTQYLTKDIREVEKAYRLAVFNVLAHNRDDHGKNFTFLMNAKGEWRLSPAYDLTFSAGPNGEQSTMILGEGKNPRRETLIKLGESFKLPPKMIEDSLARTKAALAQWPHWAKTYGVSRANQALITAKIQALQAL